MFRLSAKRTSPFKSAGASVQSTTGSRVVRISGSNAGYTMFRGGVKGIGYLIYSPVSPSLPLPCVTVCHHISAGVYQFIAANPGPPLPISTFFFFAQQLHFHVVRTKQMTATVASLECPAPITTLSCTKWSPHAPYYLHHKLLPYLHKSQNLGGEE